MDAISQAGLFRRIIEPLDTAEFVADVWERQSMALPGHPGRFGDLEVSFDGFMASLGDLLPDSLRANRVESDGSGRYFPIRAEECRPCFEQGMTVCATNLQAGMPRLVDLARDTGGRWGSPAESTSTPICRPGDAGSAFTWTCSRSSSFRSKARSTGFTEPSPRRPFLPRAWTHIPIA